MHTDKRTNHPTHCLPAATQAVEILTHIFIPLCQMLKVGHSPLQNHYKSKVETEFSHREQNYSPLSEMKYTAIALATQMVKWKHGLHELTAPLSQVS